MIGIISFGCSLHYEPTLHVQEMYRKGLMYVSNQNVCLGNSMGCCGCSLKEIWLTLVVHTLKRECNAMKVDSDVVFRKQEV